MSRLELLLIHRLAGIMEPLLGFLDLPDIATRRILNRVASISGKSWLCLTATAVTCFAQDALAKIQTEVSGNTDRIARVEIGAAIFCTLAVMLVSIAFALYSKTNHHSVQLAALEERLAGVQGVLQDIKIMMGKLLAPSGG